MNYCCDRQPCECKHCEYGYCRKPRCECYEKGTGINLYICGERVFATSLSREDVKWLILMLKTKKECDE